MKANSTTISTNETVADFGDGLRVRFNQEVTQPLTISIKPIDDEISELERRVIWKWCDEWSKQSTEGISKEDAYDRFKYSFMWPQMAEDYPELSELFDRNKKTIASYDDRATLLGGQLSRTDATHDQFHAALTAMWQKLTNSPYSIVLTKPDKYKAARDKAMKTGKTQTVK